MFNNNDTIIDDNKNNNNNNSNNNIVCSNSNNNPKNQKPKATRGPRKSPIYWTENDEKVFLKAVTKFGRNWDKVSKYVSQYSDHVRDKPSIRSHAQRWLIKCYVHKIPLPPKIRESGEGHTLSGQPLDENSAAYLSYTNQRHKIKKR